MGRSGGFGKSTVVVVVAVLVLVSCGGGSASRDRNVGSVAGSVCSKPGQVTSVSGLPVVCAKSSVGNIWYETVKARGKSVACTKRGVVRKKQGVVWVCGVSKGKLLWRATAPLPVALTPAAVSSVSQVLSTDRGTSSGPVVADNAVLANPAIPDETVPPMSSVVETSDPRSPTLSTATTLARSTTSGGESTVPQTTNPVAAAVVPLPSTFTNRTTDDGLGSNTVYGVFVSGSTVYAGTSSGLGVSTNGENFANRTTVDGLGGNLVLGVFVSGSTVYAATDGGLSISTNGGASFENRTTDNGLGSNVVRGVFVSGSKVYAATDGGLSISTNDGWQFENRTGANGLGSNYVFGVFGVFVSGSTVYAASDGGLSISK